jgi:hypothetical protein
VNHSEFWFHNCSKQYLDSISPELHPELIEIISQLPKRLTQAELNKDLFCNLTSKGWSFDCLPAEIDQVPISNPEINPMSIAALKKTNHRSLCITSSTIEAKWHSDFAKLYGNKLVQIEAQFGKVESMFKDFCGFRIAWYERRLALGIEIVLCDPSKYFSHRKSSISGMAYFEIAKRTLPAIGLDCPICLIGIK